MFAAAAIGGLVWALDLAVRGEGAWGAALLVAGAASILLVRRLSRAPAPILNPNLLRVTTFAVASAQSGALMRAAINATPYLLPLMFQLIHGMSPAEAGGMLMIYMAGNLAMKPATTFVLTRWSFRRVLAANGFLSGIAIASFAFIDHDASRVLVYALLFAAGLSRSLNFTATNTLAFADIAAGERSDASTMVSALQQAALSIGVGAAACLLAISSRLRGAADLGAEDFRLAFLVVAGGMVVSAVGYFVSLPATAGVNLRTRLP